MADSSGSQRRLPTLNTQRLRHFSRVGWDGAGGGLRGLIISFRCCACQLVQSLAPVPNTHAGSSTLLSHVSLQHGDISISPRIEAISAPPAHLNVTRQMAENRLHPAQFNRLVVSPAGGSSCPEVPIGAQAGPGAPVGTAPPPGWGPALAAVEHTKRPHLNSGAP